MQAVVVTEGQSLSLGQVPKPDCGPNEVLVKVATAGLNRADLVQRAGRYPPPPGASQIMGLEISGEIVALGAEVSGWSTGDRVCALLAGGGYAEYATVDAGSLLPIP
ncbi:MAG: alcohol dehydrogenase catalytic domain-containing protein, partial [Pseudomonadota bacterium]